MAEAMNFWGEGVLLLQNWTPDYFQKLQKCVKLGFNTPKAVELSQ